MSADLFFTFYVTVISFTHIGILLIILILLLRGLWSLAMRYRPEPFICEKYLLFKKYTKVSVLLILGVFLWLIYQLSLYVYQKNTEYQPTVEESSVYGTWVKKNVELELNPDYSANVILTDKSEQEYVGFGRYEIENGTVYLHDDKGNVKELMILQILTEYRLIDNLDVNNNHRDLGFKKLRN